MTDLCPWRQPQANHAHAQSQGPPESATKVAAYLQMKPWTPNWKLFDVFLLRLIMIINLYIIYYILYIIYSYKWLFLTIPSLPSFSHPQGHWQFHRTKCDLNWPFDNFKSLSAEHQPPHRQLSSVPLLAWSTLLKLSAALRKSPVATQRNQAQDWLEKKSWPKCKRTIQTWIPSFWETSRIWNTVKDFNVH